MKLILFTALLAFPAWSEDAPRITRIVELHTINVVAYKPVINAIVNAIAGPRFNYDHDAQGKIVVLTGTPESVDAVERFLKKMDETPAKRSVDVTIYMMLGLPAPENQAKLPQELAGVATQLRAVFGFKDFRLIETTVMRAREGSYAESSGIFPGTPSADGPHIYQTKFQKLTITGDAPAQTIRLDSFRFGGRLPTKNAKGDIQYVETGINTAVDVREGQKVVVGKAAIGNGKESLFVVLTAKIVE